MDLEESLERLADQALSGASFLAAYGLTWVVCAVLWRRRTERTAALATLFQGLVALPVALGLSVAIGALGAERPVADEITQLSVLVAVSQLLGLPFLIHLVATARYTLVPFAFAAITSMHFVLYSWLYRTPAYIVMAVVISIGTLAVTATAPADDPRAGPVRVCALTGGSLLATALFLLVAHALAG